MRKYISRFKVVVLSLLFITQFLAKTKAGDDDTSGIKFRPITYEQALAAAKAENKPIFIHCYASWCHFCIYMKDKVYPDKEVGDFYNANFICLKIDMEKEGKPLTDILKPGPYPTLVFIDADGGLIHRAAGRRYKFPFIELGKEALDPKRNMRGYRSRYESGTASPWETQNYFRMQEDAGMNAQAMISDYLMKQPDADFTNANNWTIIDDLMKDPFLPVMNRIVDHKKEFESKYTADHVNDKFINFINAHMMLFVRLHDSTGYESAKQKILNIKKLDIAEKICAYVDLNKSKMKSDWPAYMIQGKKFVEKYAMDDFSRLNEVATVYHQRFSYDKDQMSLAEQWVLRSVKLADQYAGNHLLAVVSFSLGKKEQALKAANHAIELAKLTNTDYRETTYILDLIQKMP